MEDDNKTPDESQATPPVKDEPGIDPEDFDYVGPSDDEGYVDNGGGGL